MVVTRVCVCMYVYEDDWNGLEWSNGGRVCVCVCVCMYVYEDDWNGMD